MYDVDDYITDANATPVAGVGLDTLPVYLSPLGRLLVRQTLEERLWVGRLTALPRHTTHSLPSSILGPIL